MVRVKYDVVSRRDLLGSKKTLATLHTHACKAATILRVLAASPRRLEAADLQPRV